MKTLLQKCIRVLSSNLIAVTNEFKYWTFMYFEDHCVKEILGNCPPTPSLSQH